MKFFLSIFLFLFFAKNPEITEIRKLYPTVIDSESNAKEFASKLSEISKEDNKTLFAYKGASITVLARFKKSISEKSKTFKEGANIVELALANEPNNIEIHLIRLSIQEKAPKILKYNADKKDDKTFLLEHYKNQSGNLKDFIKNFILQSKSFSEAEKQTIN